MSFLGMVWVVWVIPERILGEWELKIEEGR